MILDTITLPDDLLWVNEYQWNPVEQNIDRSLSGALLVQEQNKLYGRSVVLSGGTEAGWVSRSTVVALQALSEMANKIMTLTLPNNTQLSVIFDRDENPVEAQQIFPFAYPDDDCQYSIRIRLLTVQST